MKFFKIFLIFFVIFLFFFQTSCKNTVNRADYDNDLEKCPQKPSAFFTKTMSGVQRCDFALKPTESIERVLFSDGTAVQIRQAGCAKITQEFVIRFAKAIPDGDAAYWSKIAAAEFLKMSQIDPKLNGLGMWAQALEAVKDHIKFVEPFELEKHRFIAIDRMIMPNEGTMLTVRLFEE